MKLKKLKTKEEWDAADAEATVALDRMAEALEADDQPERLKAARALPRKLRAAGYEADIYASEVENLIDDLDLHDKDPELARKLAQQDLKGLRDGIGL